MSRRTKQELVYSIWLMVITVALALMVSCAPDKATEKETRTVVVEDTASLEALRARVDTLATALDLASQRVASLEIQLEALNSELEQAYARADQSDADISTLLAKVVLLEEQITQLSKPKKCKKGKC